MEQDGSSGLKLDNSRSRFSTKEKEIVDIDQKVQNISNKMEGRKKRAYELGVRYLGFLKDRTVIQNKNQLTKSVEKEIISDLMEFAKETNNDDNEMEGMGSIAMCALLFKSILYLRDVLNESGYRAERYEIQIKTLEDTIKKLSSNQKSDDETK